MGVESLSFKPIPVEIEKKIETISRCPLWLNFDNNCLKNKENKNGQRKNLFES